MVYNAPFRVVTTDGLASASIDRFDASGARNFGIENRCLCSWQYPRVEPRIFSKVGDMAVHERLIALVAEDSLIADGNPLEIIACRVRLLILSTTFASTWERNSAYRDFGFSAN